MPSGDEAIELLDRRLRRWAWRQQWSDLRPIQKRAIPPILAREHDVILAAATAAGKTEAAFFPILTDLAANSGTPGVGALCISPLKALINDQFVRLEELAGTVEIEVHRWHGDVGASHKKKLVDEPSGVLVITPESLEALFVRRGPIVHRLFAGLRYTVVDEIHSFFGTERGRQVQSLLRRVEAAVGEVVPRIALSATLGDPGLAASHLRAEDPERVLLLDEATTRQDVRIQVRGYPSRPPKIDRSEADALISAGREVPLEDRTEGDVLSIASDLFERLRGGHHLVFANARADVERYADLLRRACEARSAPNEFWPHHGSLSREVREDAERAMSRGSSPATIVCTSTLELGIDIGAIESVAQINRPPSVASLRQRLGRSGRKDSSAVLRVLVQEPEIGPDAPPQDCLRINTIQVVAMTELLLERWVEPPRPAALHLSTLIQQILSLICQHGGAHAASLWRLLCVEGPFRNLGSEQFAQVLRDMGEHDLITQVHTRELVLGLQGEWLTGHYGFFAAFTTPEEYRLIAGGRELGRLPISSPLYSGLFLIFAGRRWRVSDVDIERKVVDLEPAGGGRAPAFLGRSAALVHDRVRERMLELYLNDGVPPYLDRQARDLLKEGRRWFHRFGLDRTRIRRAGNDAVLFPWVGDRALATLALWLSSTGVQVTCGETDMVVQDHAPEEAVRRLERMAAGPPPDPVVLARTVRNKVNEKFHPYLGEELLSRDYASGALDVSGALRAIEGLVGGDV